MKMTELSNYIYERLIKKTSVVTGERWETQAVGRSNPECLLKVCVLLQQEMFLGHWWGFSGGCCCCFGFLFGGLGFFLMCFFIVCFLLFWVFLRGRAAKTKHSVFIVRRCIHRIIELLRLSKTFKIINYWPRITATFTTRPCPLPYLHVFWVLPEMVTPPVSWEVCFSALQLFPWFFFFPLMKASHKVSCSTHKTGRQSLCLKFCYLRFFWNSILKVAACVYDKELLKQQKWECKLF